MNISLSDKTAIICGSTKGIGLATAKTLAAQGASCILLARNEQALKEIVDQLPEPEEQTHKYFVADFSNPGEVKKVIDKIVSETTVHILINNTGGPKAGPITEAAVEEFTDAFQQHIVCNHILTKAVIPGMKEAGYGRIINVISTSVRIPINNLGVSNTIRAAVASWSKTMANELAAFNITVNNILPGFTNTERLKSLIQSNAQRRNVSEEQIENEMIDSVPMKRFGEADEIASVIAFVASPAASFLTGVSIPVDGGKTGTF